MICEADRECELARVSVGWSGMLEVGRGKAQVVGLDWVWLV